MTTTIEEELPKRFYFNLIPKFIVNPKRSFTKIISRAGNMWFTPILILSITVVVSVVVSGWLKHQATLMGEMTLPPDFQYYTAEQQAQYMQAIQSTQSPVFIYILPALASLFGIWIGWIITGSMIHLIQTLMGGRTEISTSITVVAWASIPIIIRGIVRILYMLITKELVSNPGLSGLIPITDDAMDLFLIKFMSEIDIYLIWYVILIIIGIHLASNLPIGKTALGVSLTIIVILGVNALLAYLLSTLGGLSVIRPFYF